MGDYGNGELFHVGVFFLELHGVTSRMGLVSRSSQNVSLAKIPKERNPWVPEAFKPGKLFKNRFANRINRCAFSMGLTFLA